MIQMKCKAQEMEHAIGPSAMNHGACQWFKALVIDQWSRVVQMCLQLGIAAITTSKPTLEPIVY